jgi:hypothetical protein
MILSKDNNNFFNIVRDIRVFEFKGFNLFKIFYALYLNKQSNHLITDYESKRNITKKPRVILFFRFIRSFLIILYFGVISIKKKRTIFYGASGRHSIIDGKIYDLYNKRILGQKGRNNFIIIEDLDINILKQYRPDIYLNDFLILVNRLKPFVGKLIGKDIFKYAQSIISMYPMLGFTELEINNIICRFYTRFLLERFLLGILSPRSVLLICHYGREEIIAACKQKNIKIIELMHGAISSSHKYYNFPKAYGSFFQQSLFPDKLMVYGNHWKHVLIRGNMFPEESIVVAGYYLCVPEKIKKQLSNGRRIILITSQPTVHQELCAYINFLSSALNPSEWQVIIKPHPSEGIKEFLDLQKPGFITISNQSVYDLLNVAIIHIGVYSSVVYEAIRYDIYNYVLLVDKYMPECDEIINFGIALPLRPDELPDLNLNKYVSRETEEFFMEYDPSKLFQS